MGHGESSEGGSSGWLKKVVQQFPRELGEWIEDQSPTAGKWYWRAVSQLQDPFTLPLGLQVVSIGEESLEVLLPSRWSNRSLSGKIHSAALIALYEKTLRFYWERQLQPQTDRIILRRMQSDFLVEAEGGAKCTFTLSERERETVLNDLRRNGKVIVDCSARIYQVGTGHLVAEVTSEAVITRRLELVANVSFNNNEKGL